MAGELRLRIDTGRDQAVEFVSRLANDDDFRERLQKDPKSVLWDYGVELAPELIPEEVELPAKEEIQAFLAETEKGVGAIRVGPQFFYPVFACFFAFPFFTANR
jgi:hypothetical protein